MTDRISMSGTELVRRLRDEQFFAKTGTREELLYAADEIEGLYRLIDNLFHLLRLHNWGADK